MFEVHLLDRRCAEAPTLTEAHEVQAAQLPEKMEAALFIDLLIDDLPVPKGAWR